MRNWFINRYGEIRAGWAITAAVIVMIVAQFIARPLSELGDENNPAFKLGITLVYGLVAIIGILILYKLFYKRAFRALGMSPERSVSAFIYGLLYGIVSVSLILAVLVLADQAAITDINTARLFSSNIVAEFLSVCVFAFSEELMARGFFMTALKTTRNKWLILFVPATIFALLHLMNDGSTVLSLINTFLVGLLFGYLFMKSGTLWLTAGFHTSWNFLMGDIFGMITSGNTSSFSVLEIQMKTNILWTGGSAGPEGSMLCTLVLLLIFLTVRFLVKKPNNPAWTHEGGLPLARL